MNIVDKSGAWFSFNGERIGQGRENARQFMKDNPDIKKRIDLELRKHLGMIKDPQPVAAPAPAPAAAAATGKK